MNLKLLEPEFLRRNDDHSFDWVESIGEADGIIFKCPKCFKDAGDTFVGVHSVICWRPRVPQTTSPTPGRWEFEGSGIDDLTLVAGSSSILLMDGCRAHFFIRGGEIQW